ncbi:MAG: DEAD/DEAH box helicase, partial [Flavobacteriales bacterium]|nr:DEAD/DEAH box helicase [Flavobacteriales bacterium]
MSSEENFSSLGLNEDLIQGIDSMGIQKPTPIQRESIPHILQGKDVLGIAQTGTGKTAAFLLPVIHSIIQETNRTSVSALIVVPTRELATQIDQAISAYGYFTDISSMTIYGGSDGKVFTQEKHALTTGTDIIVATPGRLNMHINLGYVDFSKLKFLILDEAERMLDMGFQPDIQRIIAQTPDVKQGLLFSATMPDTIFSLSRGFLNDPITINIALSKPPANVTQGAFVVFPNQKIPILVDYLFERKEKTTIVFSSTKSGVINIHSALRKKGISSLMMSSDLEQSEREHSLNEFRNRKCAVLVATDVVSRGIDIKGIDCVVNYDVPGDAEDYVHRIGRTGRADAFGEAVTF